jgi:prophage regulatory protein
MFTNRIIRLRAVMQLTGLSRSSIYALVRSGAFPAPVKLGQRASGWVHQEVDQWLEQLKSVRDANREGA